MGEMVDNLSQRSGGDEEYVVDDDVVKVCFYIQCIP